MKFEKHPFLAHLYELDCDYRVMLYSDTSNKNIYSHSHNFFEMFLLISGRIVYNTAGTSFYLKPGDFLFINRHQEHFPEMLDFSIPYERMALQVSPQVLKELSMDGVDLSECFTTDTFRVYHYPHPIRSRLSSLLDHLTFLYNSEDIYGKRILGRSCLAEFFVEVNKHNNDPHIFSFSRDNKEMGLMALVDQYFKDHMDQQITVAQLSEYFYMKRYYFMHRFKEISGMTIYQYILRLRLNEAEAMVRGGASFIFASQQCGFGDYSNYYRCFKKEYGVSPREYFKSEPG